MEKPSVNLLASKSKAQVKSLETSHSTEPERINVEGYLLEKSETCEEDNVRTDSSQASPMMRVETDEHLPVSAIDEENDASSRHTGDASNNPNSIGELVSVGQDLETHEGKVYRSVYGEAAITDLLASGLVQNKASAIGNVQVSRWGKRVFWSRGREGGHHGVQDGGYVIVASEDVAKSRQITIDDVEHVYTKRDGKVVDVIEAIRAEHQQTQSVLEIETQPDNSDTNHDTRATEQS